MSTATKIPMLRWNNPGWDMKLYTDASWTVNDLLNNDFLIDCDPALCTREEVELTKEEIDALPEWDG